MAKSWEREFYAESEGEAFLFYATFGDISQDMPLKERKYRSRGVPDGFELTNYDRVRHADVFDGFFG